MFAVSPIEVFTLPPLIRAESEQSEQGPRTPLRLDSAQTKLRFFLGENPANLEVPSPSLVRGQS